MPPPIQTVKNWWKETVMSSILFLPTNLKKKVTTQKLRVMSYLVGVLAQPVEHYRSTGKKKKKTHKKKWNEMVMSSVFFLSVDLKKKVTT